MWKYMKWVLSFSLLLLAGCINLGESQPTINPNMTIGKALQYEGTCVNGSVMVAFYEGKAVVGDVSSGKYAVVTPEAIYYPGEGDCDWYAMKIKGNLTAELALQAMLNMPIKQVLGENATCSPNVNKSLFVIDGKVCSNG